MSSANESTPNNEDKGKPQTIRRNSMKTVLYIMLLGFLLFILKFIFGWETLEEIPPLLQPYSSIILLVQPYLVYIQGGLVFVLGYLVVNAASGMAYTYMRRATDHPTAATIRTITKISGVAVLLSMSASVFNVNPAAALTVGSFGGLVAGFATQTILSHVVAGVFLLISRPYTFGDTITVAGQTGVVKEVKLMHLVLETADGTKEILIPSGTVVTQIIQKMRPTMQTKPAKTNLILDISEKRVMKGSTVKFTGKLVEAKGAKPVAAAPIKILDSDIKGDDLLASTTTGNDGSFSVEWKAKKTDRWDNSAEIYARFEGNDDYQPSKSKQSIVEIVD